jgi:hypothetical protein
MTKDPITLGNQGRWLKLAGLGVDAWNTWAEEELKKGPPEKCAVIDLRNKKIAHIDFAGFKFPGAAYFSDAEFQCHAFFSRAHFFGQVWFNNSHFSGDATFQHTIFDTTVDFISATFEKTTSFHWAQFGRDAHVLSNCCEFIGSASFASANFADDAEFINARFHNGADFDKSKFSADACFRGVKFLSSADYKHASFDGLALFDSAEFTQPPDLDGTTFKNPPSFLQATLSFYKFPEDASHPDAARSRYRRLKRFAAEESNHESELDLFALETKAKRGGLLKWSRPRTWLELVLNHLYELTSDYGRSVLRPTISLLVVYLLAAGGFAIAAGISGAPWRWRGAVWLTALVNLVPFVGQSELGRQVMKAGLCPELNTAPDLACLSKLFEISAVEGFFAVVFLFLLGFGLRNRFRIK